MKDESQFNYDLFWETLKNMRNFKVNEKNVVPKTILERAMNFKIGPSMLNLDIDLDSAFHLINGEEGFSYMSPIKNPDVLKPCLTSTDKAELEEAFFCFGYMHGKTICWSQILLKNQKILLFFENSKNYISIDHGRLMEKYSEAGTNILSALDASQIGEYGGGIRDTFSRADIVVFEGSAPSGPSDTSHKPSGAGGRGGVGGYYDQDSSGADRSGGDTSRSGFDMHSCMMNKIRNNENFIGLGMAAIMCLIPLVISGGPAAALPCGLMMSLALYGIVVAAWIQCDAENPI